MSEIYLDLRKGVSSVVINGVDVADLVSGLTLTHSAEGGLPVLTLEYPCYDLEVDGVAQVRHFCPLADEESA